MSIDKYKFISPGIFTSEIDNTGRAAPFVDAGPVIIGRSEKGPILKPIRVDSYADFITEFGNPIPGGNGVDVARNGNYTSPTYGAYAAQAWFRNNAPVTFVRIGGQDHDEALDDGSSALAGWQTTTTTPSTTLGSNGGAYGLFVCDAPTLSFGSASIPLDRSDTNISGGFVGPSDTISLKVNDTIVLSITASTEPSLAEDAEFSAGGFATGSTSVLFAENVTGSLLLAMSASSDLSPVAGKFTVTIEDTDHVVVTPNASVASNTLPSVKLSVSASNPAAFNVGYQLTGTNGSAGTPVAVSTNAADTVNLIGSSSNNTGSLAAVWYIDQTASIGLSGTLSADGTIGAHSSVYVDSVGTKQFKVAIKDNNGTVVDSTFNFTDTSDNFIRRVFNTNPILTNSEAVATTSNSFTRYWLGESYEGDVNQTLEGSGAGGHIGVILPLISGSTLPGSKFRKSYQDAETGFFFAQDLSTGESATGSFDVTTTQNLFKLVARNSGDYVARHLKVSIKDIKASALDSADPYGSFSVVLRKINDTDNRVDIVEQFNNCNLNPTSENYIGRKIGDKHVDWDEADRRYREFGEYDNQSKYVRVEIPDEVAKGDTDARYLPFGVRGPLRLNSFTDVTDGDIGDTVVSGNLDDYVNKTVTTFISGATNGLIKFNFPKLRLRISASEGDPVNPIDSYYGVDTTFDTSRFDKSVRDHLKIKPTGIADFTVDTWTERTFNFTLDDMCRSGAAANKIFAYKVGSRASESDRDGMTYLRGTGSYTEVLDAGVDRFTTVFHGGFDGLDIKESEPLRIINYGTGTPTPTTNYMFNSVQVAIDSIRDPEIVEYNIAAMPGIVNSTLNRTLIDMCESRGDALAVVDVKGGYKPQYESTDDAENRIGSVSATVNELKNNLVVNSSYAATYYPWVQIKDSNSGQTIWAPPSVPAIGAMSYSQRATELWFAPAGFTRGGLSEGRGGVPVVGVREKLSSRDRDTLYENRINPIASFPAEGIVIFGQKTLQATPSALDRINVRRLMIYLKRQISRFASTILFDQNVRVTWNRFKGQVEPFLRGVQAGLGITQFKMVLDETTTTPDLIDRNIVYAKIFIQPARAIEYIAIDFILTDDGAAFED